MTRELSLSPRSLIKNIPSPKQQWKLPMKQWVKELFEKKHHSAWPLKPSVHSVNESAPLHAYADEPMLIDSRDISARDHVGLGKVHRCVVGQ